MSMRGDSFVSAYEISLLMMFVYSKL